MHRKLPSYDAGEGGSVGGGLWGKHQLHGTLMWPFNLKVKQECLIYFNEGV